ncbi:MAG: hypothetical protein JNK00_11485 [Flavipsychrobacter sp.]|nr:hypothetical protein [Flavipsychrobacter sp.]
MKHFNYLKHALLPLLLAMVAIVPAFAQPMSGTYTIGGASPSYATLSAAITAINSNPIVGPVVFNIRPGTYSGTTAQGVINTLTGVSATNTVTFQAENGPGTVTLAPSSTSSTTDNFVFRLNNANYVIIKDLTLSNNGSSNGVDVDFSGAASNNRVENCILTGNTTTLTSSQYKARIFAYWDVPGSTIGFRGQNNTVIGCTMPAGGAWDAYIYGNSATRPLNFDILNCTTNPYYGSVYAYFVNGLKINGNTVTKNSTSTWMGMYFYECDGVFELRNNTVNSNTATSTSYGIYRYYCNGNTTGPKQTVANNTFTDVNASSSGTRYYMNCFYNDRDSFVGNNFTVQGTSSTIYGYFYGCGNSVFRNNNVTLTNTTGTMYPFYTYGSGYGGNVFVENNTFNATSTSNSSSYFYGLYYCDNSAFRNNTYNRTTLSATTYVYAGYGCPNSFVENNNINLTSTGGTTYGLMNYSTTSYPNLTIRNNNIKAIMNGTGTVYGMYNYYPCGLKIHNNSVYTRNTSGTNVTVYNYYPYAGTGSSWYNNTFVSGSTSTTNYVVYHYNYDLSATYYEMCTFKNNIIARTNTTSSYSPFVTYSTTNNYLTNDYNNIYAPAGNIISVANGGTSYASIPAWRAASGGKDRNSLSYAPAFVNAAAGDLTPDATNPNCWSMNGRGQHLADITTDVTGAPRHTITSTGVPDLGAYEFTPASTTIPPLCAVTPATPVAGGTQVYTFGGDTVATLTWDPLATVPGTAPDCRQYSGAVPPGLSVLNPTNMYFYTDISSPTADYTANIYYKDPWMGTIATEAALHLAKKDGSNPWVGYPITVSTANTDLNYIRTPNNGPLNTFGLYTGIDVGNNASADAIVEPAGTFCPGDYVVKVRIKNNGNNVINSVKINWELDFVLQPQISWNTPIPYNTGTPGSNEVIVTLGTINFGAAPRTFKVWTSLPNNVQDPIAADDTLGPKQMRSALLGEYTVGGVTPDFPTLVAAVADLKAAGMCGPVTFKMRPGTYVGQVDLLNIPGSSVVNRLTIRADNGVSANTVNVNYGAGGINDDYVIRLNNTSNVSIKDITLNATGVSSYATCIKINGTSDNDTISGCILNSSNAISSSYYCGIYAYQTKHFNLKVLNNTINAAFGMYIGSSTSSAPGLVIEGNNINSMYSGIYYMYNYAGAKLKYNNIIAAGTPTTSSPFGVYYWYINGNSDPIECIGNRISNFYYGMYYLYNVPGTTNNRSQFTNNIITLNRNVTGYYGLYNFYASNTNFNHNTFAWGGNTYSFGYAAYMYVSSYPQDSIYNNVFANYAGGYAFYTYMPTGYGHRADYNNLYTSGSNLAYDGAMTATSLTSLRGSTFAVNNGNAWANSISNNPGIDLTTGNPDPTNANSWSLNGRALQLPYANKDINNISRITNRANGVSDIGAVEFDPGTLPPAATPTPAIPAPGVTQVFKFGENNVATVKWNTQLALTTPLSVRQYSGVVAPFNFPAVSQNKYPYFYTDIRPTGLGSTFDFDLTVNYMDIWLGTMPTEANMKLAHKYGSTPWVSYNQANSSTNVAQNTIFAAGVTSFGAFTGIDDGVNFSAIVKVVGSTVVCTGSSVTLNASPVSSGSTTYNYQWKRNGIDIPGANASSFVATAGGDYTVVITATSVTPNISAESIPVSLTVVAPPMAVVNASGALTYCTGSNLVLDAGNVPGVTYQWQLNGNNIPGATNNTYNVTGAGAYSVIVKNIGCSSTSSNTLVNAGPISVALGNDINACEIKGVPYILDAGYPGAKYTWSTGDTTQTIEIYKGSGTYTVTVDAGPNCIGTDQVNVNLDPLPTAAGISYLRSGNTYTFSPSGPKNVTNMIWYFSDGTSHTAPTVTKTFDGHMTVKLVIMNQCGSDTINMVNWATGINGTINEALQADVYPNPANDKVTLSIKGATLKDVTVINTLGDVVYRTEVTANTTEYSFNVGALAAGRYIIRANTTDGVLSKPFNIQR